MRILVLAATEKELEKCRGHFQKEGNDHLIQFRTIGVGAISACFYTQLYIGKYRPDMVLLGGIAGCFDKKITLGQTFLVRSEIQATTGVLENGIWRDIFDMGFVPKDHHPYKNTWLVNPLLEEAVDWELPLAKAISVDEITTESQRQQMYLAKYQPLLESMEGAAFHFVCLQIGVPFLQIRSISNYVGERDKSMWDFAKAFANLNDNMIQLIDGFL